MARLQKINVAVIGLGFMGITHLRAYQQIANARIAAVCSLNNLPVNGILRGVNGNIKNSGDVFLNGAKIYSDFSELLANREIEVVDICTPTPMHPEQTIAALRAGKHVLCEKPLARTSAAARKILQVAETSENFLMPAMCMRFWPGWHWLKKVAAEKTFGKILAANFRRVSAMPAWSKQKIYDGSCDLGGALFDLHIHDTDFVNFLFGKPASVFSSGVIDQGVVNHIITQYNYATGPAVHAEGSWLLTQGFNMSFTIHCERATLDFDFARGQNALRVDETGKKTRIVKLEKTDGYFGEAQHFVDCVAQRKRPQLLTARDAVTALEICEAEEKSIRSGKKINL
jgi:predicted dehydrogenase